MASHTRTHSTRGTHSTPSTSSTGSRSGRVASLKGPVGPMRRHSSGNASRSLPMVSSSTEATSCRPCVCVCACVCIYVYVADAAHGQQQHRSHIVQALCVCVCVCRGGVVCGALCRDGLAFKSDRVSMVVGLNTSWLTHNVSGCKENSLLSFLASCIFWPHAFFGLMQSLPSCVLCPSPYTFNGLHTWPASITAYPVQFLRT